MRIWIPETKLAVKHHEHAEKDFAKHKRNVAREIEKSLGLTRAYNARDLEKDYGTSVFEPPPLLTPDQEATQRSILAQDEPLEKRSQLKSERFRLEQLLGSVSTTLSIEIADLSIEVLREHADMMSWVETGADYHRENELAVCLLCGGALDTAHLDSIKEALNHKMDQLDAAVKRDTQQVRELQDRLVQMQRLCPSPNDIAQEFRTEFEFAGTNLKVAIQRGQTYLDHLMAALGTKGAAPGRAVKLDASITTDLAREWDTRTNQALDSVNEALSKHNIANDDFTERKADTKAKLKSHFLSMHHAEYVSLHDELATARDRAQSVQSNLTSTLQELSRLKQEIRQHGPAADRINTMIHSYLGHEELRIAAVEDGYQLYRHESLVEGPVSEGEKTAIALCYFLSTVGAEGRKLKDSIVVIDDPISSLDTRALNYAFNLIRSSLTGSAQLVLLTHNLQFMNEIRKWLKGKTEKVPPTAALFFLDTKQSATTGRRFTQLVELPRLIRDYESEYHYLFYRVLDFCESPGDKRVPST